MGFKTAAPGVLVREDANHSYNGRPDRYFTIRYRVDGKRHQEALGWASEGWNVSRAKAELAKLKAAASTGEGPVTLRQKREEAREKREREENAPTVGGVWTAYEATLKDRGGYLSAKCLVNKHLQAILPLKIENLRTFHLEKLKSELQEKGYSPQTIKHCMVMVRRILRWGAIHGKCIMPALHELHFDMPTFDNTVTEFLDDNQIQNFLLALDNYANQTLANAMRLALCTGMRRSAIFALTWEDINFERKQIRLRAENAKNGRTSYIPLSPSAEKIFNDVKPERVSRDTLVFGQCNAYNREVKKITDYAGQHLPEGYRPWHALRHTFASLLASSGEVDLLTLKALLTHRDASATQRYAHLTDSATRRAAGIMDNIFRKAVNDNTEQEGNVLNEQTHRAVKRAKIQKFRAR